MKFKFLKNIKKVNKLNRSSLKNIKGGVGNTNLAGCAAYCGNDIHVTCDGDTCSATDYVGCESGDGSKKACPSSNGGGGSNGPGGNHNQ